METKLFFVVDEGTLMTALAIRLGPRSEEERKILERAGYGDTPEHQRTYIMVTFLDSGIATTDPFKQPAFGRTRFLAHMVIRDRWSFLTTGSTIDVREHQITNNYMARLAWMEKEKES